MAASLVVEFDDVGREQVLNYYEELRQRATRTEIAPLLVGALEPLVASERAYLGGHSRSGALVASLTARSGGGDRPGTVTAFSVPTATAATLRATWGRGRKQQQRWVAALNGRGRRRVFYGDIVHQGHRIVRRGKVVGQVAAIPFAQQAVEALGDQQAEAAAEAILKHVVEG